VPTPGQSSFLCSRGLAGRDLPLDLFRGLAIIAMILVNHPPPDVPMLAPFVHAPWHGWTLADTVFPGFLFAVGVSIAWVVPGPEAAVPRGGVMRKIFRRSALLIGVSIVLVNLPHWNWSKLQLSGVLAQIGCCYLVAALLRLGLSWRGLLLATLAVSAVHWALLMTFDVPGFGAGDLSPAGNASRYLDHWLLGPYAYTFALESNQPHSLMITFSAVASTLIGVLAGLWLRANRTEQDKTIGMFVAGCVLVATAQLWDRLLPINKLLWTGSYVAQMAGLSLLLLACLRWAVSVQPSAAWHAPLRAAGVNALSFYVLAQLLQRVLVYGRLPKGDGASTRLRVWIWEQAFAPWTSGTVGATLYTLSFLGVCFVFIAWLYRREIVIRL
jgi:predicted acyltransferase